MSPQFYVYVKRGNSRRWSKLSSRWLSPAEFKYHLHKICPQQFDSVTWDRGGGHPYQVSKASIQLYASSGSLDNGHNYRVGFTNRIPRVIGPRWAGDYNDLVVYIYGGADYGRF